MSAPPPPSSSNRDEEDGGASAHTFTPCRPLYVPQVSLSLQSILRMMGATTPEQATAMIASVTLMSGVRHRSYTHADLTQLTQQWLSVHIYTLTHRETERQRQS